MHTLVIVVAVFWCVPTAALVVQGVLVMRRAWTAEAGSGARWPDVAAGVLLVALGFWLNPLGHRLVATWQHERVLAAVMERVGRPLTEVYAELGDPEIVGNGIPIYPSRWTTFLDGRYVRLVELQPGILNSAYIDD